MSKTNTTFTTKRLFSFPTKFNKGIKTKKSPPTATEVMAAQTAKAKSSKSSAQTFTTLGDMLLTRYSTEFAGMFGTTEVIPGGNLGEWRLTKYEHKSSISTLVNAPHLVDDHIMIEHNCGKDKDQKWIGALTPSGDKRRRLCAGCKKRVPDTIRGLVKLLE